MTNRPLASTGPPTRPPRAIQWTIRAQFAAGKATPRLPAAEPAQIVAAAVELGNEHAIKLAEVTVRCSRISPGERYLAASQAATVQIARNA